MARTAAVAGTQLVVVCLTIAATGTNVATGANVALDDVSTVRPEHAIRQEVPGNRYLPTVPIGERPETTPAKVWIRGEFRSIQVNVDEEGNNIVGDAANEPSIAVDPNDPGRIAIGWRQFDNISSNFRQGGWGHSNDGGETWTFPGVLEPNVFRSDPVLDADADGNFYYYSLEGDFHCDLFISTNGGVSWDEKVFGFGGDKQWIAIDRTEGIGRGNIYAAWNGYFGCCGGDFTRSIDNGHSFEAPRDLPAGPVWGTLSVGPDGELYIAGDGFVVLKSTNAKDPAATPTFAVSSVNLDAHLRVATGPNPGGLLGQA